MDRFVIRKAFSQSTGYSKRKREDEAIVSSKKRPVGLTDHEVIHNVVQDSDTFSITMTLSATSTCPPYLIVFHNLYHMSSQDTARGFDSFTQRYTESRLLGVLEETLRAQAKTVFREEQFERLEALLNIGGDITIDRAGFYMDVLTDTTATEWFKLYIRQAERLNVRIGYHKKPTVLRNNTALHYQLLRNNTALHYQLLRKLGRHYNYVILGLLPNNLAHDTHLYDAIEMYLALVFQLLPPKTLTKYLPPGSQLRQPDRGCMVANPLNQHHDDDAARRASCQLRDSSDPEVRGHYKDACEYLRKVEYVPTMEAMRAVSKKKEFFRPASNEFERIVHVRCNTCKADVSIKKDPLPVYDRETNAYLVRQQSCHNCPLPGSEKGDRREFKSTMFYPIDGRPTRSMSWLGKHKKKPQSTNQYAENSKWKAAVTKVDEAP
ncbi:hypothetical protein LTR78_004155 [Recurvomyces mirabilis]|uniref:Uncharacterized protein n=1 Tax=Recurvomyces mirabilis TaxID=574656 RepID=A0AAE0WQT2_9PEZI|nr:hypothetical protein LTR78_004155 [Recurvomyces mirabilis]KAK5153674.1 hypothetical protein LTS14_007368 [Recurvomyces mirabilis]